MTDTVVVPAGPGLSETERLVDAFVAPSKTFGDILRSSSWWMPFVFILVCNVFFNVAVDKKVGFDQVVAKRMESNKLMQSQMENVPAEKRAAMAQAQTKTTRISSYATGVLLLIGAAIISLLWWASMNFGFGAKTEFKQMFAVWVYSAVPLGVMFLLAGILLFAGVGIEGFVYENPIGTNPGYYMADSSAALKAAAHFFDVFGIWSLVLSVIGVAIVSKKSNGQAAIVVVGWSVLFTLIGVGAAAAFS